MTEGEVSPVPSDLRRPDRAGLTKDEWRFIRRRSGRWQQKFAEGSSEACGWHIEGAPPELTQLFDASLVPPGRILDLGCGDGIVTEYLAGREGFHAIGLDISRPGLLQGEERCMATGRAAQWVQAALPLFPFQSETFTFAFDRGCMHGLPASTWRSYIAETARVLTPRGLFQLYHRKLSEAALLGLLGESWEVLRLDMVPMNMRGRDRRFTHAVLRRTGGAERG